MARYVCRNELRRAEVRKAVEAGRDVNGIDFLEVVDDGVKGNSLRQLLLGVRLFRQATGLTAANVRIEGGVRLPVGVKWAQPFPSVPAGAERSFLEAYFPPELRDDKLLVVRTDSSGDYSIYRLRLVKSPTDLTPPDKFDPRLSDVEFSFKVECPSDFDCKPAHLCAPEAAEEPEISYLAKDYASFRQLILDRLAVTLPDWKERSPADIGMVLVELLAYVGDQLSYYQDAVGTEAYLDTSRRRISVPAGSVQPSANAA